MATPKKKAAGSTTRDGDAESFTADERAAMKERAAELRAAKHKGAKADPEKDLLDKIAEMPESDRAMAQRLHELVKEHAPTLTPRTWYGMPAYSKDGKVLCFFKGAAKFKDRYATLGFEGVAALDDGAMWPTSFALVQLGPAEEQRIVELLARAVG
jgi:uncharacterized protein YdhG (YjbR/CyaY superfamily)